MKANGKVGCRTGMVRTTAATGDVHEGGYKDGKREGRGKYTVAATGDVYEGAWKDGKRTWTRV